jgi:hypothetical protein
MFLDAKLTLDSAKSLTAGTTVCTDKIDLGAAAPQIGDGEPMAVVMVVDTAAAGSTDTFTFNMLTDGDSALGSPTILAARTIPKARLTAGSVHVFPIPPGGPFEQYFGMSTVVGSGDTIAISYYVLPLSFALKISKTYPDAVVRN